LIIFDYLIVEANKIAENQIIKKIKYFD